MKLILSLNIPPGVVGCSKENFDSYFTKLQNICTDNMNEDVKSNAAAAAAAGLDPGKGQHIQQQGNESHFLPCCANTFLRGCASQNRSIFTQLFMQIREPSQDGIMLQTQEMPLTQTYRVSLTGLYVVARMLQAS